MSQIKTRFTETFGTKLPIIGAPMFLVSNPTMVSEISLGGGLGVFPTLNCRSVEELDAWTSEIEDKVGDKPYGVNLIVHKSNERLMQDLDLILSRKVSLIVSSLGDPSRLISEAHKKNVKVICDVINLKHGAKALSAGADGLIVVSAGAGGHAGPLSPFASLPWFRKEFPDKMIVAAGSISSGRTMAASLCLGADAVSVGTRFIASKEAQVEQGYKDAIVEATPEDIFMSRALSGVNASVMKTNHNKDFYEWDQSLSGKVYQYIYYNLMKRGLKLKKKFSWNNVWSAGQSVGEVSEIVACREILSQFETEYLKTLSSMPK
jgi:nitronate monooxygenase